MKIFRVCLISFIFVVIVNAASADNFSTHALSDDGSIYQIYADGEEKKVLSMKLNLKDNVFEVFGISNSLDENVFYISISDYWVEEGYRAKIFSIDRKTKKNQYLIDGEHPLMFDGELYYFKKGNVYKYSGSHSKKVASLGKNIDRTRVVSRGRFFYADMDDTSIVFDLKTKKIQSKSHEKRDCLPVSISLVSGLYRLCDGCELIGVHGSEKKKYVLSNGWWFRFSPYELISDSDWFIGECIDSLFFKEQYNSCVYNIKTGERKDLNISFYGRYAN